MLQPLTDRQEAILEFIRKSIRERGYPPTLREIGSHMNIRSTNGVSDHLRALERKGHLKREDMKSRALVPVPAAASKAIRVSRAPDDEDPSIFDESEREYQLESDAPAANDGLRVPLLGKVAAGALSLATQQIEQQILMDPALLKANPGETFALRVFGDSMIEAGIHEGDLLFVRKQDIAARADVVVALVGDEATVKRYYPEADHIRLQPENKRLKPIYVRRSELSQFKILGVVVGLFRPATGFGVKAGL